MGLLELKHIDPVGMALMLLGGILGYGARLIVTYALKPPQEQLMKWTIAVKLMGLIFVILAMLKIMEVF
ncbi:translation initiation factor 2 gamma subunit (eIF-2gamma) [Caldicoprobacter guelmensis]|uniref:hypothetical protein n=1 Tax=Caldicoprobacter guelmensis TaxID=1170224 RepID=UPI00195854A6|nr:hypothetical protein [Caldicoprobacter guelmensis]MBM7583221.1 translation initiation factor 2 gamma subunit (eIF-2gamma) [Caldicoprobacter guelmensis]